MKKHLRMSALKLQELKHEKTIRRKHTQYEKTLARKVDDTSVACFSRM